MTTISYEPEHSFSKLANFFETDGIAPSITRRKARMSELFREQSLERVNSPEELTDYIRVTTPSVWLVLLATTILLVGMLAWAVFSTVDVEKKDGSIEETHPITFVTN